jgi:hypothetical protein
MTWYLSTGTTMSLPACVKAVSEGKRNEEFKFKEDKRSTLYRKTFVF